MSSEIAVYDPKSKKNTVVKSNSLVLGRQHLTLQERRIIYMFISRIKPSDTDFRVMRLRVRDIAKCLEISGNNYYTTVKNLILGLQKKGVYIKKEDSILYVNWLASSEYYIDRGIVEVEFAPKMKPYLLQLKKEYYTKFKLENVIYLNSVYSMQMYELLKQNLFRRSVQFTVDNLKYMFDLKKDSYKRISQFKARIIDQAQKEINKKTDISFTYSDIKESRQIVAFDFKISPNKNYKEHDDLTLDAPDSKDNYEVLLRLTDAGIAKNMAKKLINNFSDKRIIANLNYVKSKKKKYTNMAGQIVTAIRDDYAMADERTLFDHDEISDEDLVNGFVQSQNKKRENGMIPDWILKELFIKWVHKNTKVDDEQVRGVWDKYNKQIYNRVNEP